MVVVVFPAVAAALAVLAVVAIAVDGPMLKMITIGAFP
jgi:hypothetical protein